MINAILGTLQHVKAQRSLDSLRQLSSPGAKVIRDGVKREFPSKDIVLGDIVVLEAGDMIVGLALLPTVLIQIMKIIRHR